MGRGTRTQHVAVADGNAAIRQSLNRDRAEAGVRYRVRVIQPGYAELPPEATFLGAGTLNEAKELARSELVRTRAVIAEADGEAPSPDEYVAAVAAVDGFGEKGGVATLDHWDHIIEPLPAGESLVPPTWMSPGSVS